MHVTLGCEVSGRLIQKGAQRPLRLTQLARLRLHHFEPLLSHEGLA